MKLLIIVSNIIVCLATAWFFVLTALKGYGSPTGYGGATESETLKLYIIIIITIISVFASHLDKSKYGLLWALIPLLVIFIPWSLPAPKAKINSLMVAIEARDLPQVKTLVEKGANVNFEGYKPLLTAVKQDNIEMVQYLLDHGADKSRIALFWAVGSKNKKMIEFLLAQGFPLNSTNTTNGSIIEVAMKTEDIEFVKYLISIGGAVNVEYPDFLESAAMSSNLEMLKVLIESGADLKKGNALYWAVHSAAPELVKYLISIGVDVNKKNYGSAPIHELNESHSKSNDDKIKCLDLLIHAGANLEAQDTEGNTILHKVAYEGQNALVTHLLNKKANINAINLNHHTPLYMATWRSQLEAMKILIAKGADVNLPDKDGDTPLHRVAKEGHPDLLTILLSGKPDCTLKNNQGQTALDVISDTYKMTPVLTTYCEQRSHSSKK